MNNWQFKISPDDKYNHELLENVHPEKWSNPEPEPIYNMVVVGGGTAGLISAIATASLGGKVALVERHLMGGDCLNVGCVPSKCLIRPARLAAEMRNAASFGLNPCEISRDDFPAVMERLRRIRADISKNDSVTRYSGLGVDVFLGDGHFISGNSIEVNGKTLKFRKAVIATGARAAHPDTPGLADCGFRTNETIFNLTERPEHLLVIGGGPIACELAQAFRRLGSEVSIVQRSHFLSREDPEAAAILEKVFADEGINVYLNSNVKKAETDQKGKKSLIIKTEKGEKKISGDEILVGVGRIPNVEGLGLENAGVEYDVRKGVIVNDHLRTTNKNIYAAGDCCMAWKFTHAADAAAQIAVQNALFKGRKKLSSLIMPWCTYTDPEIAHVGMYGREAADQGINVEFFKFDMSENDRALADNESTGFVKVMVKKGTDKILGATVVATHAGEMISEITTAMASNTGLGKLAGVIHPYPTQADAIRRVAGLYRKKRLTPMVAKLLKWWLKVQR